MRESKEKGKGGKGTHKHTQRNKIHLWQDSLEVNTTLVEAL